MNHKEHKLCPLLWKHLCVNTNGSLSPCCEFSSTFDKPLNPTKSLREEINSENFLQLRQDMLDGKANSVCDRICYKKEQQGFDSKRLHEIKKYEDEYGAAFTGNETAHANVEDIDYLDIKPSNFCNSKCVMCNSNRSSQYALESKKHRNYTGPIIVGGWYNDNKHKIEPIYKKVWRFKINGGETSVMPELEEILKGVAEGKSKRAIVILNINNTFDITKYHEHLKEVHHVSIVHSIEDYGKANEYIRYPAKWNTVYDNLKTIYQYTQDNNNVISTFGILVLSLNFKTFPYLVEKLHNEFPKNLYYFGHIHQPQGFLVSGLTQIELEQGLKNLEDVMSRLPKDLNNSLKNTHIFYKNAVENGTDFKVRQKMLDTIRHFDRVRNISIEDYIDINLD